MTEVNAIGGDVSDEGKDAVASLVVGRVGVGGGGDLSGAGCAGPG